MKTLTMIKLVSVIVVLLFIGANFFINIKSPKQKVEEIIKLELD